MNSQTLGRCLKLKYKDIKPCKIYSFSTAKKVRIYHIHNIIYWVITQNIKNCVCIGIKGLQVVYILTGES